MIDLKPFPDYLYPQYCRSSTCLPPRQGARPHYTALPAIYLPPPAQCFPLKKGIPVTEAPLRGSSKGFCPVSPQLPKTTGEQ